MAKNAHIVFMILVAIRAIFFPDFSSIFSIVVINFIFPVLFVFAAWCLVASFKLGFAYLVLACVLGLANYAYNGGLPYLLGADFTPSLVLTSLLIQFSLFGLLAYAVYFFQSKKAL